MASAGRQLAARAAEMMIFVNFFMKR
jgi:hypothetical protein